jgi:hypothetical protein
MNSRGGLRERGSTPQPPIPPGSPPGPVWERPCRCRGASRHKTTTPMGRGRISVVGSSGQSGPQRAAVSNATAGQVLRRALIGKRRRRGETDVLKSCCLGIVGPLGWALHEIRCPPCPANQSYLRWRPPDLGEKCGGTQHGDRSRQTPYRNRVSRVGGRPHR